MPREKFMEVSKKRNMKSSDPLMPQLNMVIVIVIAPPLACHASMNTTWARCRSTPLVDVQVVVSEPDYSLTFCNPVA